MMKTWLTQKQLNRAPAEPLQGKRAHFILCELLILNAMWRCDAGTAVLGSCDCQICSCSPGEGLVIGSTPQGTQLRIELGESRRKGRCVLSSWWVMVKTQETLRCTDVKMRDLNFSNWRTKIADSLIYWASAIDKTMNNVHNDNYTPDSLSGIFIHIGLIKWFKKKLQYF